MSPSESAKYDKEKIKYTIDELFMRSKKYRNSDAFKKFFDFIAKFDHYSRFNTMLVYLQNDAVTFFGGVHYWRDHHRRFVKEGAKPIVILQPFAPVMLVYDIFDTEGKLSPEEFLEKGLGRKCFIVEGKIKHKTLEDAIQWTEEWGIKVYLRSRSYFEGGHIKTVFSGKKEIVLKEEHNNEQKFSTLLHELAHLLLGHTGHETIERMGAKKKIEIKIKPRDLPRTTMELEAETVSFLVTKKFGLEKNSEHYIAGYLNNDSALDFFSYERVVRTADKIEDLFLRPWK